MAPYDIAMYVAQACAQIIVSYPLVLFNNFVDWHTNLCITNLPVFQPGCLQNSMTIFTAWLNRIHLRQQISVTFCEHFTKHVKWIAIALDEGGVQNTQLLQLVEHHVTVVLTPTLVDKKENKTQTQQAPQFR